MTNARRRTPGFRQGLDTLILRTLQSVDVLQPLRSE